MAARCRRCLRGFRGAARYRRAGRGGFAARATGALWLRQCPSGSFEDCVKALEAPYQQAWQPAPTHDGMVTMTTGQSPGRASSRGLLTRYAAGLVFAHIVALTQSAAILIPLSGHTTTGAQAYLTLRNVILAVALAVLGTIVTALGALVNLAPTLRWYIAGSEPNPRQRRAALRLITRQSVMLATTWAVAGATFILLNRDGGLAFAVPCLLGTAVGASAAAATSLLLTQRTLRPVIVAASSGSGQGVMAPGVLARLVIMWLLSAGLPLGVIAVIVMVQPRGWVIEKTAPVGIPVLVVSLAAVFLGLPIMILISRSISDPVCEVVDAMADVEQERLGAYVGVYERSEIGRLQRGFNRMVAGLAERERLRDLFGRHVGTNVARRAIEQGASLTGDVREAAILFIDLVGSTQLACTHPPQQVAEVLNDFFRIVVDAVAKRDGLINKFEGDAALAVFGAPLRVDGAASAALATARELADQLRKLPVADFGIGVSAGAVFAGNIGAENRYEYTVIGDPVNEAARLADLAKTSDERMLASAAAIERASQDEGQHWVARGSELLRGRSEATEIYALAGRSMSSFPANRVQGP